MKSVKPFSLHDPFGCVVRQDSVEVECHSKFTVTIINKRRCDDLSSWKRHRNCLRNVSLVCRQNSDMLSAGMNR